MADNFTERTEQPTARRLARAREQGMVPMSTELLSAITLAALTAATVFMAPHLIEWAAAAMRQALSCDNAAFANQKTFMSFAVGNMLTAMGVAGPFVLALAIAGIGTHLAMHGANFSAKAVFKPPDLFNPANVVNELFSPSAAVKLALSIVKLIFIGVIVWMYIRGRLDVLSSLQWAWSMDLLARIGGLILGVMVRICIGLLIIGVADYIYQRWRYIENLKMTKQEVKEEHRSTEGPPEVQRKIRQKQFELAMRRMLQDVPKANVVLVNPTHVAVALQYDPKTMYAPVVVAKGADHLCEKIKEIARAYGVPILRRPTLARELYVTVDIGKPIPDALFVTVAEVLALIHRLRHSR